MKKSSSLIFFGSGPVALESLKALNTTYDIELVITKPKSEKQKDTPLVIAYAQDHGLEILTCDSSSDLTNKFLTNRHDSTVGVVVDFGIIISQAVIDAFEMGIVNSHFSLLPKLRGADPISFALLEGLEETGVSLMQIVEKMDEGPLISQRAVPILATDTNTTLTAKLITTSNKMLQEDLTKYINHDIIPKPQNNTEYATYTRKLTKQDSNLDWTKPAKQLEREVRAFIEWPRSKTEINTIPIIVTQSRVNTFTYPAGSIHTENRSLLIGCSENSLQIEKLIVPGKQEMTAAAFISGYLK